jgi:hypothetical protein
LVRPIAPEELTASGSAVGITPALHSMAPQRKRTRAASNAGQRSIVDFFSKQPGPSAVGSPGSLSPVASRRTLRTENTSDQNLRRDCPKVERVSLEKTRPRKQHLHCAKDNGGPGSDEEMLVVNRLFQEVSPGICTEVEDCEDIPMTQEEEDVNDQLRSLNCSQDGVDNPASSAPVAVDADASADGRVVGISSSPLGTVFDVDTNIGIEIIEIISDNGSTPEKSLPEFFRLSTSSNESDVENKLSYEKDESNEKDDSKKEQQDPARKVGSAENFSNVDKDDDGSEHEDEILLQDNLTTLPRRSSRNQANNMVYGSAAADSCLMPSVRRIRGSVFGGNVRRGRRPVCHTRTPNTSELVRARTIRQRKEKGLEELRRQLGSGGVDDVTMDAEEAMFAKIAADEDCKRRLRDLIFHKYERPTPLFVRPCESSLSKFELSGTEASPGDQFLRELLAVASHSEVDVGDVFSRSILRSAASSTERLLSIVDMLFQLVVYDDTDDVPGLRSRRDAFWALQELLPSCCKCDDNQLPHIPSLGEVLVSYGAVFISRDLGSCGHIASFQFESDILELSVKSAPLEATESSIDHAESSDSLSRRVGMEVGSLDYDTVMHRDEDLAPITVKALRNLSRAFRLYEVAVCSRMPLSMLVAPAHEGNARNVRESALAIVIMCATVLVSPFGSQLFRDVGRLMSSVLERVSESDWPAFRLQAAHNIALSSQQLSVQVELVTYLLPFLTTRARGLALDATYLVLCQWCTGPSSFPKAIDVSDLICSVDVTRAGSSFISFTLSDIIMALGSFPELNKHSDPVWACGVMRLLKLAVADDDVLKHRKIGEIAIVLDLVKKYRKSFVRIGDGVSVQDMRIALDALRNVIHGLGENDSIVHREVHPVARLKPRQSSISTFGLSSS